MNNIVQNDVIDDIRNNVKEINYSLDMIKNDSNIDEIEKETSMILDRLETIVIYMRDNKNIRKIDENVNKIQDNTWGQFQLLFSILISNVIIIILLLLH